MISHYGFLNIGLDRPANDHPNENFKLQDFGELSINKTNVFRALNVSIAVRDQRVCSPPLKTPFNGRQPTQRANL